MLCFKVLPLPSIWSFGKNNYYIFNIKCAIFWRLHRFRLISLLTRGYKNEYWNDCVYANFGHLNQSGNPVKQLSFFGILKSDLFNFKFLSTSLDYVRVDNRNHHSISPRVKSLGEWDHLNGLLTCASSQNNSKNIFYTTYVLYYSRILSLFILDQFFYFHM